jgi:hypothetical protein
VEKLEDLGLSNKEANASLNKRRRQFNNALKNTQTVAGLQLEKADLNLERTASMTFNIKIATWNVCLGLTSKKRTSQELYNRKQNHSLLPTGNRTGSKSK